MTHRPGVLLGLLALALSVWPIAAEAAPSTSCSLDTSSRSRMVADYVESARQCLNAPPMGYRFDTAFEADFVRRINDERAKRGLKRLSTRADLIDSARFHSLDMARNAFFGHSGPDHRIVSHRVAAFDRRALIELSAENVAMLEVVRGPFDLLNESVPRLHQNLMDSKGHRDNILHEEVTDLAIGVVVTDRGVWVTQVFLNLTGTLSEPVPLRMRAGDKLYATPRLSGWTFQRFEAERPGFTNAAFDTGAVMPSGLSGDVMLNAYSEKPGESPSRKYTIRLAGPAITVQ
jgi:uncharacterized protein YkwD